MLSLFCFRSVYLNFARVKKFRIERWTKYPLLSQQLCLPCNSVFHNKGIQVRKQSSVILFFFLFFFLSVIVFTTPNTYTGYSTNITLTFTLTIYLLTTLLIHALLYNTILKKTLKKCSQSHGLVNSVSVLLSWEAQETN